MYDRHDLPTLRYPALSADHTRFDIRAAPEATIDTVEDARFDERWVDEMVTAPKLDLQTQLPVSAQRAYELFCDSERIPSWLQVVRSSRVIRRFEDGRAKRTAFIAQMERASMGYTLHYRYDDQARCVTFSTAPDASTQITGRAYFEDRGSRYCVMHYELDLRSSTQLPEWEDKGYAGHPAQAVLRDFKAMIICEER